MAEQQRVVTISDFEQRLIVNGLNDFRNNLLRADKPTEDLDEVLIKVIDAPPKKKRWRQDREAR